MTSASLHPRGCTSPAYPIMRQPARSRLPPYSGAPYDASHACSNTSCRSSGCRSRSARSDRHRARRCPRDRPPASPRTGPFHSRSGRPREPSIRVRHASSSSRDSGRKSSNPGAPPYRPEYGPPAQIAGGSVVNAPRIAVDVVGGAGRARARGTRRAAATTGRPAAGRRRARVRSGSAGSRQEHTPDR